MNLNLILYPVVALAALTFAVGIRLAVMRIAAVRRREISPRYFAINRGGELPEHLVKVNNNYNNLLELPILFYIVAVLIYATNTVEPAQLVLAWLFVLSRCVHSYIHTTYNNVRHRLLAFMTGVIVLITMWCIFFARLIQA